MNKRIISLCASMVLLLAACGGAKQHDKNEKIYTGDFAGEPIDLSIVQLDDSTVKGTSEHKGQVSEMSGKRSRSERGYTYVMKELGTSKYEGIFEFELDTTLNVIFGSWKSNDTGSRMGVMYTLKPKSGQ